MNYRRLGKTDLMVSEVGFGAEWMERHTADECKAVLLRAEELGINIPDCRMSEPNVHTRDVEKCKTAFEDLLARLKTDYIDLGMIHFIDRESDRNDAMNGPYIEYVKELKASGKIRHIGMSTHNPDMAKLAAQSGFIEMIMFSVNPAFDLLMPTDNIDNYFADEYGAELGGIDPSRAELYKLCERNGVKIAERMTKAAELFKC